MVAAPIRRKTASELYTATREAERLHATVSEALATSLQLIGAQVEAPTVQYIKKQTSLQQHSNLSVDFVGQSHCQKGLERMQVHLERSWH